MSDHRRITKQDLQRALVRIELEIVTIREEGLGKGALPSWYAFDRITAIREVCDLLLQDDPKACISGFGFEDEATAQRYLDKYLECGLHQTPDSQP